MENLNRLVFTTYKIDESLLNIPMGDIKQEYDLREHSKKYLFKILYIDKHLKDRNYVVYLAPPENSKLPILKGIIPLEVIRTDKIIPNYTYDRELEKQEAFIVDERVYRTIDKINKQARRGYHRYYLLIYGYLFNSYKEKDALTKITEGLQEIRLSTQANGYFNITKTKTTTCLTTDRWDKICSALKINYIEPPKFKRLPKGFFVE